LQSTLIIIKHQFEQLECVVEQFLAYYTYIRLPLYILSKLNDQHRPDIRRKCVELIGASSERYDKGGEALLDQLGRADATAIFKYIRPAETQHKAIRQGGVARIHQMQCTRYSNQLTGELRITALHAVTTSVAAHKHSITTD
jgi:hypothetical protein